MMRNDDWWNWLYNNNNNVWNMKPHRWTIAKVFTTQNRIGIVSRFSGKFNLFSFNLFAEHTSCDTTMPFNFMTTATTSTTIPISNSSPRIPTIRNDDAIRAQQKKCKRLGNSARRCWSRIERKVKPNVVEKSARRDFIIRFCLCSLLWFIIISANNHDALFHHFYVVHIYGRA